MTPTTPPRPYVRPHPRTPVLSASRRRVRVEPKQTEPQVRCRGWPSSCAAPNHRIVETLLELAAEYCAADGHAFVESTARSGFEPMLGNDDRRRRVDDRRHGRLCRRHMELVDRDRRLRSRVRRAVRAHARAGQGQRRPRDRDRRLPPPRRQTDLPRDGTPQRAARRLYARHGFTVDDSIWMSLDL